MANSRMLTGRQAMALAASALFLAVAIEGGTAAAENPPAYIRRWQVPVTDYGNLYYPSAAVDADGNLYVVDFGDAEVHRFDTDGNLIDTIGAPGTGDGQFVRPWGVAVGPSGDIYVTDGGRDNVQRFGANGDFIDAWGTPGSGDGQFSEARGIGTDANGNVYVADEVGDRIQKFEADGTFIRTWGTHGSGNGQLDGPTGLAVHGDDVWVVELDNDRVQRFDTDGVFVATWGGTGSGDQERLLNPIGVTVDSTGAVYVADTGNYRAAKFSADGELAAAWYGDSTSTSSSFEVPTAIAVDAERNVFVVDGTTRVRKFGRVPRPDLRVRLGTRGPLLDDDVYHRPPVSATTIGSYVPAGGTVTYSMSMQNDAPVSDTLRLRSTASSAQYTARYTVGGTDVTTQVTNGAYTRQLAPGEVHKVKLTVTVRRTAPVGSRLLVLPRVSSTADPLRVDGLRIATSRQAP